MKPTDCPHCQEPLAVQADGFNCMNEDCPHYDEGPWTESYIDNVYEQAWVRRQERACEDATGVAERQYRIQTELKR